MSLQSLTRIINKHYVCRKITLFLQSIGRKNLSDEKNGRKFQHGCQDFIWL